MPTETLLGLTRQVLHDTQLGGENRCQCTGPSRCCYASPSPSHPANDSSSRCHHLKVSTEKRQPRVFSGNRSGFVEASTHLILRQKQSQRHCRIADPCPRVCRSYVFRERPRTSDLVLQRKMQEVRFLTESTHRQMAACHEEETVQGPRAEYGMTDKVYPKVLPRGVRDIDAAGLESRARDYVPSICSVILNVRSGASMVRLRSLDHGLPSLLLPDGHYKGKGNTHSNQEESPRRDSWGRQSSQMGLSDHFPAGSSGSR